MTWFLMPLFLAGWQSRRWSRPSLRRSCPSPRRGSPSPRPRATWVDHFIERDHNWRELGWIATSQIGKHESCFDKKEKVFPFERKLLGVQNVSIKVIQLTLLLKKKKAPHPTHTQPLWQTLNLPLFQDLRSKNRKAMEALSEMEQKYVKLLKTQQA